MMLPNPQLFALVAIILVSHNMNKTFRTWVGFGFAVLSIVAEVKS